MRLSATEKYGLRCLLTLAKRGRHEQLTIPEIAQMEGLSIPYASKLLAVLRKAGLVVAVRGRSGGFTIARKPEEITLYEVFLALGGPLIDSQHCQRFAGQLDRCVHLNRCSVHDTLASLADHMRGFMMDTTLDDMINTESHPAEKRVEESSGRKRPNRSRLEQK